MPTSAPGSREPRRAWSAFGAASKLPTPPLDARSLQFVLDLTRLTFRRGKEPTAGQLQFLGQALGQVRLDELGVTPETFPIRSGQRAIQYQHIFEDGEASLGIFFLPAGTRIPLHNHPGMTVFSRALLGEVHVLSFDLEPVSGGASSDADASEISAGSCDSCSTWHADPGTRPGPVSAACSALGVATSSTAILGGLPAAKVLDRVMRAGDAPALLQPMSGGNIHQFTAITDCAVLDLLTPPYCLDEGRDCTYYNVLDKRGSDSTYLLEETEAPEDFVVVDAPYLGRRPCVRPVNAKALLAAVARNAAVMSQSSSQL